MRVHILFCAVVCRDKYVLQCFEALDERLHIAGFSPQHWIGAFLSYGLELPPDYVELLEAEGLKRDVVERHCLVFALDRAKTFRIEYEPDFAIE